MVFHIEQTQDEFNNYRYFVTNERGDWISEAFDNEDAASDELEALEQDDYEHSTDYDVVREG